VAHSPLITTVIPTHRRPKLLKAAILSALNQTLSEITVCVYDNASGDETAQVVQEIAQIDARLKYHCHPQLISAAENFQFGISSVKTPFVSILADDDLLAPDFYQTALSSLSQFPKACFFLGSTIDVGYNGKMISAQALRWGNSLFYEPPRGLDPVIRHYFNWTGAVFRSDILKQNPIDPSVKPIDLDLILRLAAQFPFSISKKPCALFVHHPKSYSSSSGVKLVWPSWLKMMQNIEEIPLPNREKIRELMFLRLQKTLLSILIAQLSNKQFQEANATLTVLFTEFPHYRKEKIVRFILSSLEKSPAMHWIFNAALNVGRFLKTWPIQLRYGRFAKDLIRAHSF
jgi:glycosyltransferase involved in cell wall biosynthesis